MDYRPFTNYEQFIYLSRYSRWIEPLGRRETWPETVMRVISYLKKRCGHECQVPYDDLYEAILNRDVMPSMRVMMAAGPAMDENDIAAYNCSFLEVDSLESISEALYVLMHGTGLGFSVTEGSIGGIGEVNYEKDIRPTTYIVGDSKEGWRDATDFVVRNAFNGIPTDIDYSQVRPAGARLKTFGGRASGPEPLKELHNYIKDTFRGAANRSLAPIEMHGIICKVAQVVVVGGVRRSALISLSDLNDDSMRNAKSGAWWEDHSEYALANNSAIYETMPSEAEFKKEWAALRASGSGERGIFNKVSAVAKCDEIGRDGSRVAGTNPCGEILLRDGQFCNLTEVILRPDDSYIDIAYKVECAAILGTLQSNLDNLKGLRAKWSQNTTEERLLGVSMTGIMDNTLTNGTAPKLWSRLAMFRELARDTNKQYADILGISHSAAITTVKPSGTVSQLCGTSSGIHPSHAQKYIRRVRMDQKDPLTTMMIDKGVPNEVDFYNPNAQVFSFGVDRRGSVSREDLTAIEFLELWLTYKQYWTDHNPSVTISVKEDEWDDVGDWVYENFTDIGGLSFLPYDNGSYQQAPYETTNDIPGDIDIDWNDLTNYEKENNTTDEKGLACSAGLCEI